MKPKKHRPPRSAETRAKISATLTGYKHTPEARAKISATLTGRKLSPEHRAKLSAYKHTAEARAKVSAALTGRKLSPEHRAKLSAAFKGKRRPPFSDETRAKMSAAKKGRKCSPETRAKIAAALRGPKCYLWRGGISRLPYAWTFNAELKEEVRRRDGHRCQCCGVPQAECTGAMDVHHINYDKKDSDPLNLVTLCHACHSRTNAHRAYWTAFFQAMALNRHLGGGGD